MKFKMISGSIEFLCVDINELKIELNWANKPMNTQMYNLKKKAWPNFELLYGLANNWRYFLVLKIGELYFVKHFL